MKGLKELVEQSLGEFAPSAPPPVDISGEAVKALSFLMRKWSGWNDAVLRFGTPVVSPWAQTDRAKHEFVVNVDDLLLNPNRVLRMINPFRLKQEAVLTGAMLHEAGHARHSNWLPMNAEDAAAFVHGTGSIHAGKPITKQTLDFAKMVEEPRVEGFIAKDAELIGATGLVWTMRAMVAALLPLTELSSDPDQQIMDIIASYVLRAGRQVGVAQWTDHTLPTWSHDFAKFTHKCVSDHMVNENGETRDRADVIATRVMSALTFMILNPDDSGTYMVDTARDVLDLLYPNGSSAQPQTGGCQAEGSQEGQADEGSDGQGNSKPEDEGEGTEPGAGTAGDGEEDSDGASPSTEADAALQQELSKMEGTAKSESLDETDKTAKQMETGGMAGGKGPGTTDERGYRIPDAEERLVKKGAEKFLRSLIEPTEASKVLLSDQPSANIDAARYAAWRADGGQRDPQFFRRTRRSVEPAPPVDIAILADISSSMGPLQKPTALLSWALASACVDLRNFAGRGVQIRCMLVHWGDTSRVIVKPGESVQGLKEYDCDQGTSAMHEALADVEQHMPGFFDYTGKPSNRLLVHFTDWLLFGTPAPLIDYTSRALAAGVNMLSVVPQGYSVRRSKLPDVLKECKTQRGKVEVLKYNPGYPSQVWDVATQMLGIDTNPGSF